MKNGYFLPILAAMIVGYLILLYFVAKYYSLGIMCFLSCGMRAAADKMSCTACPTTGAFTQKEGFNVIASTGMNYSTAL
jgi:hypothetical protein